MDFGINNTLYQERLDYLNQMSKNSIKTGYTKPGEEHVKASFEKEIVDKLDRRFNSGAPYGFMAEEGSSTIEYNGVTFHCDDLNRQLTLGDVSDPNNTLTIPMSGGGVLKVNRDNLGDLSKAIGMFSPEDVKRILQGIAQDTKAQSAKNEVEEQKTSTCEKMVDNQNETEKAEDVAKN